MRRFITKYPVGNRFYGSHIFAKNIESAEYLCRVRNIGEVIEGSSKDLEFSAPPIEDYLHEACFLSFICLKAGLITVEQALGDDGIVHEIAHKKSGHEMSDRIEWLRKITPGYAPL